MINTFRLYEELRDTLGDASAQTLARILGAIYEDLKNTVTKDDFRELKQIVTDLAKAQNKTEERVEELAEAQKRTEKRVEELAEAQKRTEKRVEELAEAQKRTEKRVEELAEAQKRTEKRVEELAEAQKRTEKAVYHLSRRLDETNRQLGGLAMTVGYTLENTAFVYLPTLLREDYGIVCTEPLYRDYLRDLKGRDVEVNILGRAKRNDQDLLIVGESKAQLSKNDITTFLKRLSKLDTGGITPFPVLVTHMITHRDVKELAKEKGVALYLSYRFQKPIGL